MGRRYQGKRGRKGKSKAANLAERFILYKTDILRFLPNAFVPFDNNQAERDIRMVKVKEKVSGSFRTEKGAIQFARIRGFTSTVRKQGRNLLESIMLVSQGQFSFSLCVHCSGMTKPG
ncbi:transposase [Aneurinibacillus sp. Ricciae_BoGa-3]|uniref:IS66 family transposase n=1 Tax=Aneurinibacillus sp. Ricciae_BoGa-3 TaxID=3022697 RepID=UPI00234041C9|nr:transposase [Aneurinibacillus sp. Ricciae_BoGa-3]WCK52361.1 transposase [Aneurinibacillus sp. Ricciae_BoGa-3]